MAIRIPQNSLLGLKMQVSRKPTTYKRQTKDRREMQSSMKEQVDRDVSE